MRAMRWQSGLPWLMMLGLVTGCAGYQIGNRTLYRPDVRTVHVPIFQSESFRRNLGERLTEAVAKEIERKTPYRVASAARADSILRGRLVSESKRVIAENGNDVPRIYDVDLVVQVEWIGPQGNLLAGPVDLPVAPYLLQVGESAPLIPEAGQSVAVTYQDAIEDLAEQIVAQMEAPAW